jgi:ferritin-like metal-binding protein YciE
MAFSSLKDIYIDQMQDIYSACKQSKAATQKLHDAATDDELKKALKAGAVGIQDGMDTLSEIIKGHGEDPTDEFCKGMEGLVKEVHAHVLDEDFSDDDVRDAMIITQYQRLAHYAIAGYGCVRTFANRLDLDSDAAALQECLDKTWEGDRHMSKIAEGGVNAAAMDGR